jgi:hypothetical protein
MALKLLATRARWQLKLRCFRSRPHPSASTPGDRAWRGHELKNGTASVGTQRLSLRSGPPWLV